MMKLANAIVDMVRMSVFLRPILSPKRPKTIPPTGRATKPTAKTASTDRSAEVGLLLSKKLAAR